jgi:hypothetical protein
VPEVEGGYGGDGDRPPKIAVGVESASEIVVVVPVSDVFFVVAVDPDERAEAHGVVATEEFGLVPLADEGEPPPLPELSLVSFVACRERFGLLAVRREACGGFLRRVEEEVGGEGAGRFFGEVDPVGNDNVGIAMKESPVGLDRAGGERHVAIDHEEEVIGSAST